MPGEEKKGVLGKVPKKSMESFSNSEKFPIPYFFFFFFPFKVVVAIGNK